MGFSIRTGSRRGEGLIKKGIVIKLGNDGIRNSSLIIIRTWRINLVKGTALASLNTGNDYEYSTKRL